MRTINLWGATLFMLAFSIQVNAQNRLDGYFEQYQEDDRFSQISVSSRMFDLFVNLEMDNPDEQAMIETLSKLEGLKALIGMDVAEAPELYAEMLAGPQSEMEELMSVKESNREFHFFITETDGKITELVMVGYDHTEVMMISLIGDIDLEEIAALSQKMDIDGFNNFKNLD